MKTNFCKILTSVCYFSPFSCILNINFIIIMNEQYRVTWYTGNDYETVCEAVTTVTCNLITTKEE